GYDADTEVLAALLHDHYRVTLQADESLGLVGVLHEPVKQQLEHEIQQFRLVHSLSPTSCTSSSLRSATVSSVANPCADSGVCGSQRCNWLVIGHLPHVPRPRDDGIGGLLQSVLSSR